MDCSLEYEYGVGRGSNSRYGRSTNSCKDICSRGGLYLDSTLFTTGWGVVIGILLMGGVVAVADAGNKRLEEGCC